MPLSSRLVFTRWKTVGYFIRVGLIRRNMEDQISTMKREMMQCLWKMIWCKQQNSLAMKFTTHHLTERSLLLNLLWVKEWGLHLWNTGEIHQHHHQWMKMLLQLTTMLLLPIKLQNTKVNQCPCLRGRFCIVLMCFQMIKRPILRQHKPDSSIPIIKLKGSRSSSQNCTTRSRSVMFSVLSYAYLMFDVICWTICIFSGLLCLAFIWFYISLCFNVVWCIQRGSKITYNARWCRLHKLLWCCCGTGS